jgi:purine-binding chemotaxis protein CheW
MVQAVEEQAQVTGERVNAAELGGKYLTFALDREEYGLEVLRVREIIRVLDITRVPHTADHLRGVINLRGKVIPVVDLRVRFGLPPSAEDERACIIVVDVGTLTGIIVDEVREVNDIPGQDIEPPPEFGAAIDTRCLLGMGKVDDAIKILLDIEEVLGGEAFTAPLEAEANA